MNIFGKHSMTFVVLKMSVRSGLCICGRVQFLLRRSRFCLGPNAVVTGDCDQCASHASLYNVMFLTAFLAHPF